MSKTIKQIADELGVSKTAIRNYMTADFRSKYVEISANGLLLISDEGAIQLQTKCKPTANQPQTKFAQSTANQPQSTANQPQTTANQPQTECENGVDRRKPPQTEFAAVVEVLQTTIDTLQGQLATKDEQIKTQQEQISALQSELERERQHARNQAEKLAVLADQAQQLHAADKKALLAIEDKQDPPKRHWWQRKRKEQTEE